MAGARADDFCMKRLAVRRAAILKFFSFEAIVLIGMLVSVTSNGATPNTTSNLWKMGASGVSSRNGNAFVVTAEYMGPTTSLTNLERKIEGEDNTYKPLPAKLMLHTGSSRIKGTKFSAGYYRGSMVFNPASKKKLPEAMLLWKTNLVSIFSSPDLATLVVAEDNGPVYSSTNAGITWRINSTPGKHEYALDEALDRSGLFAEIFIPPNSIAAMPSKGWYVSATAQNGNALVLTGDESAPVLSISYADKTATITWLLTSATFVLQRTADLTATNWTDVTTMPIIANGLNQVVISTAIGNQFYRLKKVK